MHACICMYIIKMKEKVVYVFLVAAIFLLPLPSSMANTYCVSEEWVNCNSTNLKSKCHSLMCYVNRTQDISFNNSLFIFSSGSHYLNNSKNFEAILNISNVANITLQGNESTVICEGNQTGLLFYNSSKIFLRNLKFNNCGANVNSSLQTSLFFELTNHINLSKIAIRNSTGYGLYMNSTYGIIAINNSVFDRSKLGNAMFQFDVFIERNLINSTLEITSSNFTNGGQLGSDNSAGLSIYLFQPHYTVQLSNLVLRNNSGRDGGNIAVTFVDFSQNTSQVIIENNKIDEGKASNSGGGLLFTSEKKRTKDEGSCTSRINVTILKVFSTKFHNNNASSGGGAQVVYHEKAGTGCTSREVVFENCNFTKNTAVKGAVMYVTRHELPLYSQISSPQFQVTLNNSKIHNNFMRNRSEQKNQDGIVQVLSVKDFIISNTNFTHNKGTALILLNSAIRLYNRVAFEKNNATFGGAIRICDDSRMYFNNDTRIQFHNNSASQVGGAIYIGNQCLEEAPPCFFQFLSDKDNVNISSLATDILSFDGNNASYAGHALYGGSVDKCFTDLKLNEGFYYSFELYSQVFKFMNKSRVPSLITSDPYGTCVCKENTNQTQCENRTMHITMYPGQYYSVYMSAVGQLNGTVPAFVIIYNDSKNFLIHLDAFKKQEKYALCKNITFTISLEEKDIPLYPLIVRVSIRNVNFLTESSNYFKLKKLTINVTILSCPFLFELNKECKCHPKLIKVNVTCDISSQAITRPGIVWIDYALNESTNECQLTAVSSLCKLDRCRGKNTLTQSNFSDICVTGRTGRLCGACASNYSLTLGPFKCVESDKKCSASATVLLVLVFILAGLFIIFFIAFFNLTVAEGAINGFLFYANCFHANSDFNVIKSTYYFTKVLISWLNLDFGFEVCFYAGMTAYQKIWLEFGFLVYLLLLGVMIVCLSRKFVWFTRLAGRNVVPVLATIAMLAYPKLIRLCILAFYCTRSRHGTWYTDGKHHWVWGSDETIECYSGIHIVLFVLAVIMFLIALVYALCLFLIQCLLKGSGCCVLRWVDKLRPFFDAHTGPCNDNHRFWPGLLLCARLIMYILFAIIDINRLHDGDVKGVVLTTLCISTIFLAIVSPKGVYRKWALNVLEFLFLFNVTAVSVISSLSKKDQYTHVGDISVGIAILMLLLIIFYNCWKKISKARLWMKIKALFKQKLDYVTVHGENTPLVEPIGGTPPLVDFTAPREELLYDN